MIDWHTHVLPHMDDGSHSLAESLQMLQALGEQGITHVLATPHFYPNEDSVESFLQRRAQAYGVLAPSLDKALPRVLCGAEVAYYPGIAKMKELKHLTVEGTNLLLLEMPMTAWRQSAIRELIELSSVRGFRVVLAHFERAAAMQSKKTLRALWQSGVLVQVNAGSFRGFFGRRRMLRLFKTRVAHVVGSDCHNMITRAPNIGKALALIKKRCGSEFLAQMNAYGQALLAGGKENT